MKQAKSPSQGPQGALPQKMAFPIETLMAIGSRLSQNFFTIQFNTSNAMLTLNPPNILRNEIYVAGLKEPLLTIADILDEQDQHEFALALRNAAIVCQMYVSVVIKKEAVV